MAEATDERDLLAPLPRPDRHEVPPRWAGGQGVLTRAMATRQGRPIHALRGLFIGQPDVTALTTAPLLYQLHASAAWRIWGAWPFIRLLPAWNYPLWFLWRPCIVYRSRVGTSPNEPGTGGRRWRRIETPY